MQRLREERRGSVALLAALTLTLLCGAVGLAIDIGVWYRTSRAMQNAADASAIAAARDGTSTYQNTGKAVAARYGFVDGSGGITVTIANNVVCPSGNPTCYKATINDSAAPQFFSKVLGVNAPALTKAATVDINAGSTTHSYCMLSLAESGASPAVLTNGAPNADLSGCTIMSNTSMTCHGHNLNADAGDAVGTDNGCGNVQNSGVPPVTDPYASMATTNIPANPCTSYWNQPAHGQINPPASNAWSGSVTLSSSQKFICGDLVLTGNTTITTPTAGTVVYIENGTLNVNGYTLQSAAGSGISFVFTGTSGSYSATPYPTGGGTLNFAAPTSGTWSGVAIYLDPAMPAETLTYSGNSPTWNITGLVYMPHASLTFSGAVNTASNGAGCFVLVIDNITINGTGAILSHGGCGAAGVTMPTNTIPGGSPALVL